MQNSFFLTLTVLNKIKFFLCKLLKIKTLGSRALVVKNNEFLLVKHTYTKNWYTVGGGLEKNEAFVDCIVRELWEEVGIKSQKSPSLLGIYHNRIHGKDDYVALYLVTNFTEHDTKSYEIQEKKWFTYANLPTDISPATRRRIEEYLELKPKQEKW